MYECEAQIQAPPKQISKFAGLPVRPQEAHPKYVDAHFARSNNLAVTMDIAKLCSFSFDVIIIRV